MAFNHLLFWNIGRGNRVVACRWACVLLLMVELALVAQGQGQPDRPAHKASQARVQALLGPPPFDEAASWVTPVITKLPGRRGRQTPAAVYQREQRRLWARRQQWVHEPLAFVVWSRLAQYAAGQQLPDSGVAYLRRALAANQQVPGYALDASELERRLSNYYWSRQAYDSALACHRREIRDLLTSGYPSGTRRLLPLAIGDSVCVGIALAGAHANVGLALRRRGDYGGAVRAYAQGRSYYQRLSYRPGLVWLDELLGEAYEEQGNDARALQYYRLARRTAASMQATEPLLGAVNQAQVLDYTYELLVRQHRYGELRQLLAADLATTRAAGQRDTSYWRLAAVEAGLWRRQAELALRTGQPGAEATLRQARRSLAVLGRRVRTPPLRRYYDYYAGQAEELVLRTWQQRANGQRPGPGWVSQALRYADSLDSPAARTALHLRLAGYLVQAGEAAPAAALLPAIEASYRTARNQLRLRDVYQLEATAYAALGRWQPAYQARQQLDNLTDSLRAARQYAALAELETRYQTAQKETQITQLRALATQQRHQSRLAWLSAGLLTLLLAGATAALLLARRLTRRLREARATQDRLYSVIGHDLRSPLAALGGLATLLDHYRQAGPADPAVLDEVTTEVRQTTSQLTGLVDNLLHWAASQSGELTYQPEALEAAGLLHEVAALYAAEARARQTRLAVTVPPGLPRLWADHNMVRAQLRNLLGNALKVAPPGSAITLAAELGRDGLVLRVADAGPGLSAAQLATLQTSNTPTGLAPRLPGQRGTGLGLPLVRHLAQRQQGLLWLESTPGHGTTACLLLPVAREKGSHFKERKKKG